MTDKLNRYSSRLTQVKAQGASQAMLYATGMTDEDMDRPMVGIASVWYEGNPCNMHLNDLSEQVKLAVQEAGLVGMRFNTIGVSDGISMGTDGMSYSLQSREIIADSIETVMAAHWYDGIVTLPGCDKNMPGCVMAMARLNRPGLMVYGGTIQARLSPGDRPWTWSRPFRPMASTSAARSTNPRARPSLKIVAPAPVPAAACTRPTPWPRPSKPWD